MSTRTKKWVKQTALNANTRDWYVDEGNWLVRISGNPPGHITVYTFHQGRIVKRFACQRRMDAELEFERQQRLVAQAIAEVALEEVNVWRVDVLTLECFMKLNKGAARA